jgi:choline dehydrogenase-like flavoprotein
MTDEHYDAIVIGTSQGGRFLPVELAKAGRKVALVERGQLGDVCVNSGCTPTKTMVASARLAYRARRGAEYGVDIGPVSVDLAAVRERKRAMVAGARQNYASRAADEGSHLLSAIGRVPNTEALTPGAAGIRLNDRGFIEVDGYLETSVPGVYAMGDVKGGPGFTHLSYDDYRILHTSLIKNEKASTRGRIRPLHGVQLTYGLFDSSRGRADTWLWPGDMRCWPRSRRPPAFSGSGWPSAGRERRAGPWPRIRSRFACWDRREAAAYPPASRSLRGLRRVACPAW